MEKENNLMGQLVNAFGGRLPKLVDRKVGDQLTIVIPSQVITCETLLRASMALVERKDLVGGTTVVIETVDGYELPTDDEQYAKMRSVMNQVSHPLYSDDPETGEARYTRAHYDEAKARTDALQLRNIEAYLAVKD